MPLRACMRESVHVCVCVCVCALARLHVCMYLPACSVLALFFVWAYLKE